MELTDEDMKRIWRRIQRSLVEDAINSDNSPDLTVYLVPNTPKDIVDVVIQDLQKYTRQAEPFYLESMDKWGIGIIPKDREAGKALLDYCDKNRHIGHLEVNMPTVPESAFALEVR